jgi:ankyrin repeat protein
VGSKRNAATILDNLMVNGNIVIANYYAVRGKLRDIDLLRHTEGGTVLYRAARDGHLTIVKGLLAAEVDMKAANDWGWTPLHATAGEGHIEVEQSLLTAGVNMNMSNFWGSTPLYTATGKGHIEVVQSLLTAGADSTRKNRDGQTALDIAYERGHKERSPSCCSKRPMRHDRIG